MSAPAKPLRIRPETDEIASLVAYVEVFADQHELGMKDSYALNLAAEELFANTVNHSDPPATFVEFSLLLESDNILAAYTDDGPAFDPTQMAAPDTTLSAMEREIGGLGIHFIRKTMQDLCYARQGSHNVTTFRRPVTR